MSYYTYDEELPGGFQDADLEMAEMEREGRAMRRAQKQGVCFHNSTVGYLPVPVYPEQEGLRPGQRRCTDGCGQVFDSDEDYDDAVRDLFGTYT